MNFLKRLLTAIVLLPLVIAVIHYGGLMFSAAIVVVVVYLSDEIVRMTLGKSHGIRSLFTAAAAALTLATLGGLSEHQAIFSLWCFLFFFGVLFTFRPKLIPDEAAKIGLAISVFLYAFIGIVSLFYLRAGAEGGDVVGRSFIYLALVCTFSSDTFAYIVGRWIGKHPLIPTVSEKKTWEGFFAGAVGSVAMPFIVSSLFALFDIDVFAGLGLVDLLFVSMSIAILAPIGDLIESRIKRSCDVKDSGALLPGHGGLFDRIDALLVTIPFTLGYAFFIRPL